MPDSASLLAGVDPGAKVVILAAGGDGLQQMSSILQGYSELSAIHILSHGGPGSLRLSGDYLDYTALDQHSALLEGWATSLSSDADILIYGCDVAAGEVGELFVSRFAELTGADVAASDDATGNREGGGDWQFEKTTGQIDASTVFNASVRSGYSHLLAVLPTAADNTVTTNEDTDHTFATGDFNFADGDSDSLTKVKITTLETVGALEVSGVAVALNDEILLADITGNNFTFTPVANANGSSYDNFQFQVHDGNDGYSAATYTMTIDVTAINDAPGATNTTITTAYTEDDASVALTDIVVSDDDSGETVTATLTLANTSAGVLTTSGGATYTGGTGVWTLTDTVTNVNTALAAVSFTPTADFDLDTTITVNIADGGENGAAAVTGTITLDNTAVNDAPVLNSTYANYFGEYYVTPMLRSDTTNGGITISTITPLTTISDVDTGAVFGVAVYGVTGTGIGSWEYNIGGGWVAIGAISNTNALLLESSDMIRFVPDGSDGQRVSFSYVAWDQTSGSAGDRGVDVSSGLGGSSAYSTATGNGYQWVNEAPVLDNSGTVTMTTISEDETSNSGHQVETLLSGLVTDSDSGAALDGIAVTAVSFDNGIWQYSSNAGTTWQDFRYTAGGAYYGNPSSTSALLLDDSDYIRFLPDGNNPPNDVSPGTATFTFRAWDKTGLSNLYTTGDRLTTTSVTDGAYSFSVAEETVSISVTTLNDAPVLVAATPAMTAITYADAGNSGDLVSSILSTSVSDVDTVTVPVEGMAIFSVDDGTQNGGDWEYSTDNGTSWSAVGTVSSNSALLLRAEDKVRFNPTTLDREDNASFSYYAWDQTQYSGNQGRKQDASSQGGATAFSTVSDSASIRINTAPVLVAANPTMSTITEDEASNSGDAISTLLASSVTDSDAAASEGVAIYAVTGDRGTWQYKVDAGAWTDVGAVASNAALLLKASDSIRYVPDEQNAPTVTPTFSFYAWDQTLYSAGSKEDVGTRGDQTAFSSVGDSASLTVTAVNDAPVLTAAAPTLTTITESDTANSGHTVATIVDTSITDVDDGASEGIAIYNLDSGNGSWQYNMAGSWIDVGTVSSSAALLLESGHSIRFVPDGDNATTADFSYYAWDTTANSAGDKVDVSTRGTTTAFGSTSDTASITVSAVNDAPVNSVPAAQNSVENQNLTFSSANGNLISISDVDAGAANMQTVLTVTQGTLAVTAGSGATVTNDGSASVTIDGTVTQINSALASVTYSSTANYFGSDTLTIATSDLGNSGSGGVMTDSDMVDITVRQYNDQLTATNTTVTTTYSEDDATVLLTDIVTADSDSGEILTVTLTLANVDAGVLTTSGTATYDGTTGIWTITDTVANVNTALAAISFTPTANHDTDTTISVNIVDGGEDATVAVTGTITLDVTATNHDDPSATNSTTTATYMEDASSVAITDIVVVDPDSGETIQVTLLLGDPDAGVLTTSGGAIYDSASGIWSIDDTVANVNSALAALTFTPAANYETDTSIAVTIQDGGESGASPITGTITLDVTAVNDAPTQSGSIAAQSGDEDNTFSFTMGSVFSDVDANDSLTYSVSGLPSWLSFDSSSLSFSGLPAKGEGGSSTITVTATDSSGSSASTTFELTIASAPFIAVTSKTITSEAAAVQPAVAPEEPAVEEQAAESEEVVEAEVAEEEQEEEIEVVVEDEAGDEIRAVTVTTVSVQTAKLKEIEALSEATNFVFARNETVEETGGRTDTNDSRDGRAFIEEAEERGGQTSILAQVVTASLDSISSGTGGLLWMSGIDQNLAESLVGATVRSAGGDNEETILISDDSNKTGGIIDFGVVQAGGESQSNLGLSGMLRSDTDGSQGFFAENSALVNAANAL